MPYSLDYGKNWNLYHFKYRLTNNDFEAMVYKEYFIYDAIAMIGSVGGTLGKISNLNWIIILTAMIKMYFYSLLGIFIGFSISGTVSWIFSYLKKCTQTTFELLI